MYLQCSVSRARLCTVHESSNVPGIGEGAAGIGSTGVEGVGTGEFDRRTGLPYTIPVRGSTACETPNMYSIGGYIDGTVQLN